jgi:RimJ/RimL family protein N-acetyltransferase
MTPAKQSEGAALANLGAATIPLSRVVLRSLQINDAEEMTAVLSAPELYEFIGGHPPSTNELRQRYARYLAGPPPALHGVVWLNWIVCRGPDQTAIGTVQATVQTGQDFCAELAWVIGVPWQRRGYAKEAARGVAAFLREAGVGQLVAFVAPGHVASAAVAAAVPLRRTGELRDGELCWSGHNNG